MTLSPIIKLPFLCMRTPKLRVGSPTLVTKLVNQGAETNQSSIILPSGCSLDGLRFYEAKQGGLEVEPCLSPFLRFF